MWAECRWCKSIAVTVAVPCFQLLTKYYPKLIRLMFVVQLNALVAFSRPPDKVSPISLKRFVLFANSCPPVK